MQKIIKWLENYWYHYKIPTLIVAFFVIILGICIGQMATKESYDAGILYTGPHLFVGYEKRDIQNAFASVLSSDLDGDGEKNVLLADMTAFTDEQAKQAAEEAAANGQTLIINAYLLDTVTKQFSQEIMAGDELICLLDPYWYGIMLQNDALVPLAEILGQKPEKAMDDYGIRLSDTDFGQYFTVFSSLPEDTILCMRRMPIAAAVSQQKRAQVKYDNAVSLLKDIFAFRLPFSDF